MRTGDWVHGAKHGTEFVRPTSVIDEAINGAGNFAPRLSTAGPVSDLAPQFAFAHLQHFRGAIQNLAAQIRALLRPATERRPRRGNRVPKIFSRRTAVIRQGLSIVSSRGGHAPAL